MSGRTKMTFNRRIDTEGIAKSERDVNKLMSNHGRVSSDYDL